MEFGNTRLIGTYEIQETNSANPAYEITFAQFGSKTKLPASQVKGWLRNNGYMLCTTNSTILATVNQYH